MSQAGSDDSRIDSILRKDISKAVRGSTLLYLVNAVGYSLIGRTLIFFLPSSLPGQVETVLEVYVGSVAVYAVIIYFLTRSRRSAGLGVHFYLLGLLGLAGGGLLFVWGSIGFLSSGYWLRQFRGATGMKCVRDDGNVVAFGEESLVCTRCSKLVKIGLDLPRRWIYTGISLVVTGIVLYFLASVVSTLGSLIYAFLNVPVILVLDGAWLVLEPLYVQRTLFGGGYVRLPPGASEPGPA